MTTSEIATVLAWHDALSESDLDTLVGLSSEDIEFGDADGAGQGREALRSWAASVASDGDLGRMYVHHGVVVVEHTGTVGALAFRVVEDHVTSVFRHENLASALSATDLTESDLVD